MAPAFHLVVVPSTGSVVHVALGTSSVRIGSSPEAEVHLPDPELAPVHARIEARGQGHVIVREQNPMLVNGLRAKAHLLSPNDLVVLGKNAIAYRAGAPPSDSSAGAAAALRRLREFAKRVRRREDVAELVDQLLSDVLAMTDASRGTLVRFTASDDPVRIATVTRGSFSGDEVAFSSTLLARMRDEGRAVLVANTAHDPIAVKARSLAGVAQSAIAAPIAVDDRVLGALYVSARAGALGEQELELLELYACLSVEILERERKTEALEDALASLGDDATEDDTLLIGVSPRMRELRRAIRKIAAAKAPVLIAGETGTGKELVAREIHRLSPRASRPFVAVNCGAIPAELLASELFGHVRGAFTQAHKDRLGFFRSADGGTLFLDEIGEMPVAQQVALLRVLQEGSVTPIGAEKSERVDVRIVCASNRALDDDVRSGRFRQDLFFRIAVVRLELPALRERAEDAVLLADHFLRREAAANGVHDVHLTDGALRAIRRARWEGNVRELEAAIRRAVLLRDTAEIGPSDLGLADTSPPPDDAAADVVRPLAMARDEFLRGYVRQVVAQLGGSRTAAAGALLVTPRTIFKYLEE